MANIKNKILNRKKSKTRSELNKVISYCVNKRRALDLGCGTGANSIYLAKQGFDVIFIELNQNLIDKFRNNLKKESISQKIKILNKDIENFPLTDKYDLILASFVLHFFRIKTVRKIVGRLKRALNSNGVIMIRVFSSKDSDFIRLKKSGFLFAPNEVHYPEYDKDIHYFEKKELKDLLAGLDIIDLREYKKLYIHPPEGKHQHWMFDVIARK
jgi:SAM-dependent methyltransferase